MPDPKPGEPRKDYMSRCIPELIDDEGYKQNRAAAICYSMYDNHGYKPANTAGSKPSFKAGLKQVVDAYKSISLSDQDVMKLVNHKARVLIYSDLKHFRTLDEALGPHKAIFLLYETRKDYGHWVAVFQHNKTTVEFFDPYGIFPDEELYWTNVHTRKMLGQDVPYLSSLLLKSKYPNLEYNNYKFQKEGSDINTCGRWSALRIALRDMSLEDFKKNFLGKNSDDLVTILTSFDLN